MSHTMESIMKLGNGFMASRVFLTGAELDLYTLLAPKPLSIDEILEKKKADRRGMGSPPAALRHPWVLLKNYNTYQTEPPVAPFLTSGSPDSILPMALHMCTLWKTWSGLTDVVLGKPPVHMKEQGALAGDHIKSFIGAMHNAALKTAPEVVAAVNPDGAHHLIDVGGGSGSYTMAFLNANPNMKATLFDLPEVIDMARERLQNAGLINRVTLKAGDFYEDELPGGNDLALLSAIIHQNGPAQNEALFRKIYRSLDPGGRIIVRDHVMSEDRTQPPEGAMFAVNMLVGTPHGGTYTFNEIKEGLSASGFTRISLIRTKGMFSLVEGFKS
jgi:ubiquinone/menaquinone biosynthesis C-methylase UbiE